MLIAEFSSDPLWIRLGVLYTTLEVVAALGILIYSYSHRASSDGRRRVRLIITGNIMAAVPAVSLYLLPSIIGSSYRLPGWVMGPFLALAPLSYLYATARHNLFGIDRLLNRALVYALLSLGVLLLYLGPFVVIYHFLPGDPLLQMMIAVGLTILVGFSFDQVRTRVQRVVDHIFYGGWYDYTSVIETISDALARTIDRTRLTEVLTQQVPAMMHLHPGQLQIGEAEDLQAHVLPPSPATLQFQLAFRRQIRGLWTAGPRRDGDDLTITDRRILHTLARQAEVALNNVLLVETLRQQLHEIRTVQRQLLRSREEERSRLARDLHDSPIQRLVALNMQLGLLQAAAGLDAPGALGEELGTMRQEVRHLLAELRQVCAELRPPMLDALGLGAALRTLADDWSAQSGIEVQVDIPPNAALRSLPEEVAVNLYRVVQEALSNISRHAQAQHVQLRLIQEKGHLSLIVQDDGQGFTVPASPHKLVTENHFGLAGMYERVDLIGGSLRIESAVGQGTKVWVVWGRQSSAGNLCRA